MPDKDFNLLYELTHPPLYLVRLDADEVVYVYRDVDEQFGVVRWIAEYFAPQDNDSTAITFDMCGEPSFSELDMLLRDAITDMVGIDIQDDIEFVLYEKRHVA